MRSFRKTFKALIGFDRRERRGTYILSVLLVTLFLVRLIVFRPGRVPDDYAVKALITGSEPAEKEEEAYAPVLFIFDPNNASYAELLRLGLTEKQARTLVNYRSSGAHFRRPQDILKVYGVDSATASRLIPYIIIGDYNSDGREERATGHHVAWIKDSSAGLSGGHADMQGSSFDEVPEALTDLNSCSAGELIRLPGIGPVLSERIIKYRSLLGGFVDTHQLGEVYGLDSTVVSLILPRLTLTFDSVRPLVLDSASFGALSRHPYVGYESARVITRYRSVAGSSLTLGAMVSHGVITPQQAERLAPYVRPSPGVIGNDYEFISSKVLK
ncbi:MAG: helix-hairpin-helix domain-containing protein [Bacteroidales bacterium]|nr:helix-hairpin-helix domain-containing protein [Bacteroidales bacterium]